MAIRELKYDGAFQVTLDWTAGLHRTIIYSRPGGSGPLEDDALLQALQNRHLVRSLGSGCDYGPETKRFSYSPDGMAAQWIDICYCDFNLAGDIVAHQRFQDSFFNGVCKVSYSVKRIPIADSVEAIWLTVKNRSNFDLESGGIGYCVGRRIYRIPVQLPRNAEITLPQFEVPIGTPVQIKQPEGGYPVQANLREAGSDRRGE